MAWILRPGGRPTYVSDAPQSPGNAPPGHETLAAHARATVEADGAPTWPEGCEEIVARKIASKTPIGRNGCLFWQGIRNPSGYAMTYLRGKRVKVSRALLKASIGQVVRHSCDNPGCVNIDHLSLGTQSENIADMVGRNRHWCQKKTHCPSGHEYNDQNTIQSKRGDRQCKVCHRDKARQKYHATAALDAVRAWEGREP